MGTLDDLVTDPQLPLNGMTIAAKTTVSDATPVINHPVNVRRRGANRSDPHPTSANTPMKCLQNSASGPPTFTELRIDGVI